MKRLQGAPRQERLEAPHARFCEDFANEYSEHRKRVYKRWYTVYIATIILTVSTVILLLVFGVDEGNRHLSENLGFSSFADKAASFFHSIDFPFLQGNKTPKPLPAPDTGDTDSDTSGNTDNNDDGKGDTEAESTTDTHDDSAQPPDTDLPSDDVSANVGGIYDFDYSAVPDGHVPLIPMDLSLSQYGEHYINNTSGYTPDIPALLNKNWGTNGYMPLAVAQGPLVLIVHTHGTEGYSPNGAVSLPEGQEDARSTDTQKNVVSVGRLLADTLIKNGVPTAHCTVMHDSVQYKDSYARAEETIKKYLDEYPTIKLVIDLHRDSIIKSSGEVVRPVAELDGKAGAQLMCVVGTPWEGERLPQWQDNLSLALKLRQALNAECENICRPVFLKSHTYNQEIAPYSLLIEVGASGNSLEEAQRSAVLLGEKLAALVRLL